MLALCPLDLAQKTTTLIISNKKMEDNMRIVKSLEESGLPVKGVTDTIKIETKEQKGGFLGMLLGTLGGCLLQNLLSTKTAGETGWVEGFIKVADGAIRARQDFQCCLIL